MNGMLSGIRVVDFTANVAGPACSAFLADMGAEVIKVERPMGEEARLFPPYMNGYSGTFVVMNRGKKGITIDLKKPEGLELFKELVAKSDVVLENFRPGVMKKLGLDYDSLVQVKPDIIMCSISGYGQYGPFAHLPAYDSIIQAMSGLMSSTGFPDGPPVKNSSIYIDLSTAMHGAFAICAALVHRSLTGKGEYLDVSMYDVAVNLLEMKYVDYTVTGTVAKRTGNRYPYVTPFDTYQMKDGFLMICCAGDQTFSKLCDAIGQPELMQDSRFNNFMARNQNEPAIKKLLEDWGSQHTMDEAWTIFKEYGVPAAPILDVGQVVEQPHTAARGLKVTIDQPTAGPITIFGPPTKPRNTECKVAGPAPLLGQDNQWMLEQILGKTPGEIEKIKASGIIG